MSAILTTRHDAPNAPRAIATLTINRPDKLNALSGQAADILATTLAALAADDSLRVIILTGAGKAFSSGFDLSLDEGSSDVPDLAAVLRDHFNPLVTAMRACPKPIIAAVNGVAAGAGVGLVLAADLVLMADQALLFQPFANIGLVPAAGNSWFLSQALGRHRAAHLMMTAERITAQNAVDWGLAVSAHPAEALQIEALGLAETLVAKSETSLRLTKALLTACDETALAAQLEQETAAQAVAGASPEWLEATEKFRKG